MNKPDKILLMPNISKKIGREHIIPLVDTIICGGCKIGVLTEHKNELAYLAEVLNTIENEKELEQYDIAIVLGGDGSIIDAAHRLLGYNIPIIGINYGHIGFLAELEIDELEPISQIMRGEYYTDERMMLDAVVLDENGDKKASFTLLNDLVLSNGPVTKLIKFDVFCDKIKIESCRADGIIIATPTGSTAYSLSAGGPVLDPALDCTCLTPICPHTLSSRPLIVRGNSEVRIAVEFTAETSVYLSADGRDIIQISQTDTIIINRSEYTTKLVRMRKCGFLEVLRAKLADN